MTIRKLTFLNFNDDVPQHIFHHFHGSKATSLARSCDDSTNQPLLDRPPPSQRWDRGVPSAHADGEHRHRCLLEKPSAIC